jgi:hypothetical protein
MYTERKKNLLPLLLARENQEGPRDGHNNSFIRTYLMIRTLNTARRNTAICRVLLSSKLAAESEGKTKESPMPLSRRKIHVCESHKKPNAKGKIQDH